MPEDYFFSCLCCWHSDIVLGHVNEAEGEASQNSPWPTVKSHLLLTEIARSLVDSPSWV